VRVAGYTAAAFDRRGIVAFEACAPGLHGPRVNDFEGPAFVVQLDAKGRVLTGSPSSLEPTPGQS